MSNELIIHDFGFSCFIGMDQHVWQNVFSIILQLVLLEENIITSKKKSDEQLQHEKIYGDPDKIIHFMDYSNEPPCENTMYIPDLVPGLLQPLEIVEDSEILDEVLSTLDIESLVKQAKISTGTKSEDSAEMTQQMQHFPEPTKSD